jgi:hypothetical protein
MGGREIAQSFITGNKSEANLASGQKSDNDYMKDRQAYLTT